MARMAGVSRAVGSRRQFPKLAFTSGGRIRRCEGRRGTDRRPVSGTGENSRLLLGRYDSLVRRPVCTPNHAAFYMPPTFTDLDANLPAGGCDEAPIQAGLWIFFSSITSRNFAFLLNSIAIRNIFCQIFGLRRQLTGLLAGTSTNRASSKPPEFANRRPSGFR